MPLPVGTADSAQSSESTINDLLGAGLSTETAAPVAEDTSVADEGTDVQADEGQYQDDGTGEDDQQADDASADDDAGEGEDQDIDLESLETDYAESAYQRAAEHWKKKGVELDLQDPGQRAMLKDWLDRGRDARTARAEIEAMRAAAEKQPEKEAEATAPPAPVKTPQEQMQERLQGAEEYAKTSVVPEVAMKFAQRFVNAMWPGKGDGVKQEQAIELAQAFTMFGSLLIADALGSVIPAIRNEVPKDVAKAYPQLERLTSMADRESAVEEVVNAVDTEGRVQFPGIDKLIDNGTIKRLMNGPELKDAVFEKDPYKNMVAKMKVAYRMARGQNPNPQVLARAVQTGRRQASERARAVAAGRTPPGNTRRGFAQPKGQTLKDQILSPGKGGFHALLHQNDGE